MLDKTVKLFGFINTLEGYSYITLLFVAMPLKYFLDLPIAVKVVGMLHGVLFIFFIFLLIKSSIEVKWSFKEDFIFLLASLIPFGTFFTKNKIKAYE